MINLLQQYSITNTKGVGKRSCIDIYKLTLALFNQCKSIGKKKIKCTDL